MQTRTRAALLASGLALNACSRSDANTPAADAAVPSDTAAPIDYVTVTGTFTPKQAPLLFDKANEAYEKGTLNSTFASLPPTHELTFGDTRYNPASVWQSVSAGMFIQNEPALARHSEAGAYYFGSTGDSWIGDPRVHPRSGTPVESSLVYVSWWFKQQNDTRDYIPFRVADVSSGFAPAEGEEFTVTVEPDWTGITEIRGRVIHFDPATSELVGNFYGQWNDNRVTGGVVTLDSNGAQATLVESTGWRGANKFIRVWEGDGQNNTFRLSWTNTSISVFLTNTYKMSDVTPRQWNHLEIFIDQAARRAWTKVNGKPDQLAVWDGGVDAPGHSPTIGLIGFDASVPVIQTFWMDDIYLDAGFRRVTLADAEHHADITHEEVQIYDHWTSSEIGFTPSFGALDRSKPIYVYVYDDNDVPNPTGFTLASQISM